ncbi:hypothetical protein [Winogradskyella sp. MH6]|uniref:hypothetical protein n=1 Tax=Winogradskyella sp. MH6 TaxID=2929510 RepID=UPI001FB55A36|nr:hypothetical protein [Winogradskyella sp. MH6]
MKYNLEGGVLIIGSLYWQDWLNEEGDDIRKNWRDNHLDMTSVRDVKAPVRYGRFSGKAELNNQTYTMVFDKELPEEKYGNVKVVPFKTKFEDWKMMKDEVHRLSNSEGGKTDEFIKGNKQPWCVCGIIINPKVETLIKKDLLSNWSRSLRENKIGYKNFEDIYSEFSMSINGEFLFSWPDEVENLDVLIATATRPKLREGAEKLTIQEISNHVDNRAYFMPNLECGINTFQDEEILKCHEDK